MAALAQLVYEVDVVGGDTYVLWRGPQFRVELEVTGLGATYAHVRGVYVVVWSERSLRTVVVESAEPHTQSRECGGEIAVGSLRKPRLDASTERHRLGEPPRCRDE